MSDMVTNKTGEYLKWHADCQQDADPAPVLPVETYADVQLDIAAHGGFENIKFLPSMTLEEAGQVCRKFDTETHYVQLRAHWIDGKLVVALHSRERLQGLDALLQAGSEQPLAFLRSQAS